ncbi:hypothetical protein ['Camptotheca acuminata' phytoplasma]|uniref:hypothetical protein n=1 Tax='Camptotheca acuminata' phytoplasma TaxID=3239192 RepID=UPI003519E6B4
MMEYLNKIIEWLPHYIIYIDCVLIVLTVFFTVEKSVIDIFSEQYGNYRPQRSQVFLNRFVVLLFMIYFIYSYLYLKQTALQNK